MLALVIGVIAGIASTVQASINTEARRFFRSPFITAGLNFMVAWLCLAAFIIFNEHALSVLIDGKNIYEVTCMQIKELQKWVKELPNILSESHMDINFWLK